ncbi:MAG: hypothetical protein JOZ54_18155, partial [Acidobacteria bacterium]|nr:hypothetical protein [Acidobacteriota bacterium]
IAVSATGFGALLLTNPVTHWLYRGTHDSVVTIAMRGFVAPLHMVLLVGAVLGVTRLLRERADVAGLVGGALTIAGWAVGIRILAVGQLESLAPDAMHKLLFGTPLVWQSIVPMGLLFPIGAIVLGITLLVARAAPWPIGALLILGGLCFPIGRIGFVGWALVGADVLLGAAFTSIGWQFLRQRSSESPGSLSATNSMPFFSK